MNHNSIGLIYGIHQGEIPATQLGELLESGCPYKVYQATRRVRRSTNYRRAMDSLGVGVLLDIHSSSYMSEMTPKTFFQDKYFTTPIIPLKRGRIKAYTREALLSLRERFPVFYVSYLIGEREHFRLLRFNPRGNIRKTDYTTTWATSGWTKTTYYRVVTAELWVPTWELEEGVHEEHLHRFKDDVLSLAEWMGINSSLFTD